MARDGARPPHGMDPKLVDPPPHRPLKGPSTCVGVKSDRATKQPLLAERISRTHFAGQPPNTLHSRASLVKQHAIQEITLTSHEGRVYGALRMLHARQRHDVAPVLSHVPVPLQSVG